MYACEEKEAAAAAIFVEVLPVVRSRLEYSRMKVPFLFCACPKDLLQLGINSSNLDQI